MSEAQTIAETRPPSDAAAVDLLLWRRAVAFLIDVAALVVLVFGAHALLFLLGVATFGLAFAFSTAIGPLVLAAYYALTLGREGRTPGMRLTSIRVTRMDGAPLGLLLALAHAVLFYATLVFLTPLVLLVGLFNARKRLLHDYVLTTVAFVDRTDVNRRA